MWVLREDENYKIVKQGQGYFRTYYKKEFLTTVVGIDNAIKTISYIKEKKLSLEDFKKVE